MIEKQKDMRISCSVSCFFTAALPSFYIPMSGHLPHSHSRHRGRCKDIFKVGDIFTHYLNVRKKKKNNPKCLMPLFSGLAKCAFRNLLTQAVLLKEYLGSTDLNFYIYLWVCYLRSEGVKIGLLLFTFIFSWKKKSLMKSGMLLNCFYMFQYFYYLLLVSGLQKLFKN